MILKTISDKARTFTFTYDFADLGAAQAAGNALMGYMVGSYAQPVINLTYKGQDQLLAEYLGDSDLTALFNRICDSFKDYHCSPGAAQTIANTYKLKRVEQLKQTETYGSLLEKVAACELELMGLADSVLDDDFPDMATNGVHGNLEAVDDAAMKLLKKLDTENDYKALWQYASR